MEKPQKTSSVNWQFLAKESALLLLWSYVILAAGSYRGITEYGYLLFSSILAGAIFSIWLIPKLIKGERVSPSGLELGIIIFIVTQLVSMAFSEDIRRSVAIVGQYIIYVLVFYRTLDLLRNGWTAALIERTFLIAGGIVIGIALFEHISNFLAWQTITDGLPHTPGFKSRLYALFGDAPLLAAFTNLLIPFALVRVLSASNILRRLSWVVYALAGLSVVYFSDTRGGYLGTATIIGVLAVLWIFLVSDRGRQAIDKVWGYLKSRQVILVLLIVIILTPVILVGISALRFQGDATHAPLLSSRTYFWEAAWESIKAAPMFGSGPGTYATNYMKYRSVPPDRPYSHAHNMLINFGSESGVLGLIGVLVFGVFLIKRMWKTWQDLRKEALIRWVAICACLLGHLVHTIADQFIYPMATGISLVVILAILTHLVEQSEKRSVSNSFHTIWLVVPALVVGLWGIYSLRAYSDFNKGLALAEQNNFVAAVEKFDQAVQKDPSMAYYWMADGYANGMLYAEGDKTASEEAIRNFEQGITIEPVYSLNYANLGMLYWAAGQIDKAIDQLQLAISAAPWEETYWLNLGFLYEENHQEEQAREAYWKVLGYKPILSSSTFWNQSEIRREIKGDWMDYVSENPKLSEHLTLIEQGREALSVGDIQQAEEHFVNAQAIRPHDSLSYLGLAELAIARGDLETADRYLVTALSVQSLTYDDKIWPLLAWAQVGAMQGEKEASFQRYMLLYEMVTEYPIDGWGRKGRPTYAWVVFRREGLPLDVLPQVIRIDLTPELASGLLPLVEMLEERGEFETAQEVESVLLPAIP